MRARPAHPRRWSAAAAFAALLAAACEGPPPPPPEPEPPAGFDAGRALEHARALAEAGGAEEEESGAAARAYLREALEGYGLEVRVDERELPAPSEDAPAPSVRNVIAELPGESEDLFLLVAPYAHGGELSPAAAEREASGAGLLLELARVLAERPLHYGVRLAFVERARADGEELPGFAGSWALADALMEEEAVDRLRLLADWRRVCAPDLRIARDLLSDRVFRRHFFAAARELGHEETFPPDAPFTEAAAGHRVFFQRGFRRTVAIAGPEPAEAEEAAAGEASAEPEVDAADAEPEAAESEDADASAGDAEAAAAAEGGEAGEGEAAEGEAAEPAAGACSRASLAAVGETSARALREIAALLHKVDRFATTPEPEPEGAAADETPGEDEDEPTEGEPEPETTAP